MRLLVELCVVQSRIKSRQRSFDQLLSKWKSNYLCLPYFRTAESPSRHMWGTRACRAVSISDSIDCSGIRSPCPLPVGEQGWLLTNLSL